ncbi:SRPBCC family protein [Amycolatopsis suaedae]|uniref:SRPBCC family protein n=1 Tax=Amycolatopsis suaedae TaxID=2510978 RepID=A0A4Q7JBF5_9PSEU|nr:SRPBCC family protein [Amycolatopsis suaedae]RZQ65151.1 SRPBCC family protein [Amycolatopsis suaedae]
MSEPNATGTVTVLAEADTVYALVSDPGVLAELSEEYAGFSWLNGATEATVGARFRGRNQRGVRRWSTVSTVTETVPGRLFAFDVTFLGLPISRWRYDLEPAEDGCVVTESTWDRRPAWLRLPTGLATGVMNRAEQNTANIAATLRRLKARAEGTAGVGT